MLRRRALALVAALLVLAVSASPVAATFTTLANGSGGQGTVTGTQRLFTVNVPAQAWVNVTLHVDLGSLPSADVGWQCGTSWASLGTVTNTGGMLFVFGGNSAAVTLPRSDVDRVCSFTTVPANTSASYNVSSWYWELQVDDGLPLASGNPTVPGPAPAPGTTPGPGAVVCPTLSPDSYNVPGPCYTPAPSAGPSEWFAWSSSNPTNTMVIRTSGVFTVEAATTYTIAWSFGKASPAEYTDAYFQACVSDASGVADGCYNGSTRYTPFGPSSGWYWSNGLAMSGVTIWTPSIWDLGGSGTKDVFIEFASIGGSVTVSVTPSGWVAPSPSPGASGAPIPNCIFWSGPGAYYTAPCDSGRGGVPIEPGSGIGDGSILTGGNPGGGMASCLWPGLTLDLTRYVSWIGCMILALPGELTAMISGAVSSLTSAVGTLLRGLFVPGAAFWSQQKALLDAVSTRAPFAYVGQLVSWVGSWSTAGPSPSLAIGFGSVSVDVAPAVTAAVGAVAPFRQVILGLVVLGFALGLYRLLLGAVGVGGGGK